MMPNPANNIDVKRRNRANTLRSILSCDRISQTELTQRLTLSWPTVLQNVKELTALGLVQEVGEYDSTGGRKAKAYAPVRNAKLAVGLDVTQNHVGMVLVDLSGQIVRYTRKKSPFSLNDRYFQELGSVLRDFIGDRDTGSRIQGVGVSLPGIVDKAGKNFYTPTHWVFKMCRPLHLANTFPTPALISMTPMPRDWQKSAGKGSLRIWCICP
ncbi:MAG: winged helix-turn-helix transcriptional regulator [Clostridia bacterium]